MFFNKKNNYVRDDELLDDDEKKSFFKELFKKKEKNTVPDNNVENDPIVDFDHKYSELNKKNINVDALIIKRIIMVVVILIILFGLVPIVISKYNKAREKYVEVATNLADEVKRYYNLDGQICNTPTRGRYYYYFYDTKEKFGKDYASPFTKRKLEGYVEIDIDSSGNQSYYVSFSDGMFGMKKTNINNISKSDVGLFSYLKLERHSDMKCSKEFVFSN